MQLSPYDDIRMYYESFLEMPENDSLEPIHAILERHPEAMRYFMDIFAAADPQNDLEVVCEIILAHQAYKPAVDYLLNVLGKSPKEYDHIPGFVEVFGDK